MQAAHVGMDAASENEPTSESQHNIRVEAGLVSSQEPIPEPLKQAIGLTRLEQSLRPLQSSDATKIGSAQEETNRVLSEIGDVLRNVNRTLLSIQHSQVRVSLKLVFVTEPYNRVLFSRYSLFVWSSARYLCSGQSERGAAIGACWYVGRFIDGHLRLSCVVIQKYNLPPLTRGNYSRRPASGTGYYNYMYNSWGGDITDEQLGAYLKFYDIGANLIEGDGEPMILPGKKEEAEKLLYKHLHTRVGSGWAVEV